MLTAIRARLAASAPLDLIRAERDAHHHAVHRPDREKSIGQRPSGSLVERFQLALEAVSGQCVVVPDEDKAVPLVQQILEQHKAKVVAVSDAPLVRRLLQQVQQHARLLKDAAAAELFQCDVGITGAQWAIAETGTLVLESEQERHRLISLVPPVHIAIIEAGRIRQTLGEVLMSLGENGQDGLSRTVTFITGPSRTSDIELTLAIGVHGPQALHVIVIDS